MKIAKLLSLLAVGLLCWGVAVPAGAQDAEPTYDPDAIVAVWETAHDDEEDEDKSYSRVEIYKQDDKYYGKIIWLSQPEYPEDDEDGMAGQTKVDRKNPDESLQDRPIMGLEMLRDFVYDKEAKWKDGRIYDPKSGKTYRCKMEIVEGGKVLKVRGYIKVGFVKLGRTTEWTLVEDPTPEVETES